jgi:hypothetical protein
MVLQQYHNLYVFICQASYPSVTSRPGISGDSLRSLNVSKVSGSAPVSQPPAPLHTPKHQVQKPSLLRLLLTSTDKVAQSAPAFQPKKSHTITPLNSLGSPVMTQPTAWHSNVPSTRLPFTNTTVSI